MTTEAQPIDATANRGFVWWLSVILAPIGLFGGPIEIANMVSGVVAWHGPIGYIVNFWSENISVHFAALFGVITNFFHIAPLSDFVVSYLTLGILLCTSTLRALTLLGLKFPAWGLVMALAPGIFTWPAAVFSLAPALLEKRGRPAALLVLAPFLIFVVLWIINALWAQPGATVAP
jgi:hypothetical protein